MTGPGVSRPGALPLPAYWIGPPYMGLEPADGLRTVPGAMGRQSVLALGIVDPERDVPLLAECVPVLRSGLPWHPLVVWIGGASAGELIEVGRAAAQLRIRCMIVDGEPIAAALRQRLTEPDCVPGDVVAWLRPLVGCSEVAVFVIERLLEGALRRWSVGETLAGLGLGSERTIQSRLREEGLPPAREWRHLASATYTALRLQRYPERSLDSHALGLGHGERSTLIRQLRAVFGAAPRAVRRTVGWEPWVWRWVMRWRRMGYFPNMEWREAQ